LSELPSLKEFEEIRRMAFDGDAPVEETAVAPAEEAAPAESPEPAEPAAGTAEPRAPTEPSAAGEPVAVPEASQES
jgi:hypothetical protein